MRFSRSSALGAAGVLTLTLMTPAPAHAATTVGAIFDPSLTCSTDRAWLQTADPAGTSYAVAGAGALVSMSFRAGADTARSQGHVFVARPAVPGSYAILRMVPVDVAAGATTTVPVPGGVKVFPGDRLGVQLSYQAAPQVACARSTSGGGGTVLQSSGLVAQGGLYAFGNTPATDTALDVAATVEPDADGDGFGDETQDGCTGNGAITTDCVTPDTSIVTDPPAISTDRKAKFRFSSTEAGSTFECKLKGKAARKALKKWKACSSPVKYKKLKTGGYRFLVRATDAAGNTDASPAMSRFKVVPQDYA